MNMNPEQRFERRGRVRQAVFRRDPVRMAPPASRPCPIEWELLTGEQQLFLGSFGLTLQPFGLHFSAGVDSEIWEFIGSILRAFTETLAARQGQTGEQMLSEGHSLVGAWRDWWNMKPVEVAA